MKVLHVIARMNVGGTARYLTRLSNGLERAGIDSSIATGFVQGAEAEDPSVNSVTVHRINHLGRALHPIADHKAMKELLEVVAELKPNVIHSHTFKAGFITRIKKQQFIKAAGKNLKFVHTFHGHLLDDPEFSGPKRRAIIFIEQKLAKRSEKLVTVGQKVADELLQDKIGNSNQFINIPPGVKALPIKGKEEARGELGLDKNTKVVGWLARVTGVKNPLLAADIANEMPDVQFIFGGDGDFISNLKNSIKVNSKVFGWVDATTFISACDVILSTSENEGMPVALIEAQLAGKPVVATNVGSSSEVVIDGKTGFITNKSKPEIIAKLRQILVDQNLANSMSESAKAHAEQAFSPATMVKKHIDLYESL